MSCDVEINIFGKVSNPEAIYELADSAAAEGKVEFLFDFKPDQFLEILEQAAREKRALKLFRGATTDFFEGVRDSCQAAGLSFVLKFGDRGSEGYSDGIAWRPGMDDEFNFVINGNAPALKVEDVKKAAELGVEAVNALVEKVTINARVDKIEIEPGFVEAYRALVDAGGPDDDYDLEDDGISVQP